MEVVQGYVFDLLGFYDRLWELRDPRVENLPLMSGPLPTVVICLLYVYIVTLWGPNYMRDRKPIEIRTFLIVYNACQVVLSTGIFVSLLWYGWATNYTFGCQPVDYSNGESAIAMMWISYIYYLSKFSEFIDTFCFVARKKFGHISLLHVVHHGIMPLSVWPGVRWVPGGSATFFGLLNVFVHMFMYFYYMIAAMGPKYSKYIWWKQHMTTLQMVQFIGIMTHGFQFLFMDESCGFPWQYGLYIGAHAVLFFILFSQFYIREYVGKKSKSKKVENQSDAANGHAVNGSTSNGIPTTSSNGHASNGSLSEDHGAVRRRIDPVEK